MNADANQIVPEELLAHANFVRALAARLVGRNDDADDVTQDAWLATLRAPPRESAHARSWFGRVVQRFAIERRRTTESRVRREKAAASSEALVSTQELAAKNEVLRLVADAVVSLDETHRAVILLRFYDGSPTSAVARRLGLPLETVRSRLKRALVLLRGDLDRRAKGGREEWLGALAAVFPSPGPATAVVVASSVTAKLLSTGAIAAILFGGIWMWNGSRSKPPSFVGENSSAPVSATPKSFAGPAPTRALDPQRPVPSTTASAPRASEQAAARTAFGRVSVTVVDAHGRVVPGMTMLTVRAAGSTDTGRSVREVLDDGHPQLTDETAPVGEVEVVVRLENRPSGTFHEAAVVREADPTSLTLRYGGPDPASSICVRLDGMVIHEPPIAKLIPADSSAIVPQFVSETSPFLVAMPVGSGPHTLRIDDPRWKPVRIDDLHASDAIAVPLVGSAALRVIVRKIAGGPPIAGVMFTIAHEQVGMVFESNAPSATANADGSMTFEGLEPDSFILVVHVEGNVSRRVPISDLRSGETRVVDVVLDADNAVGTIEGVLYESDALTPLANRSISLYAPARVDDSPKSVWFFPLPPRANEQGELQSSVSAGGASDSMRLGKARAQTDEHGRFRFTGLPLGRWILRYSSKALIETVLETVILDADHPKRDDVELVESEGATIVGRLVTKSGAAFTGILIFASLAPAQAMARMDPMREWPLVPVAADGSFRIGPLPPGPVELRIRDDGPVTVHGEDSEQTSYFGSGDGLALAKVELPSSGEVVVNVPADDFIPGEVRLTVMVDGKPQAGMLAATVRAPGGSIDFPRGGKSDENGRVRIAPLLPGGFHIALGSATSGWTVTDVANVDLDPAGVIDQVVSVQTVEGTVTLSDAAGRPLRERSLFVATPINDFNDVVQWGSARTDADGKLTLRWPVGRILFSLTRQDDYSDAHPAVIQWTSDGPKGKEIRVR